MAYRATLAGKPLAAGTMQEVQAAVSTAVTELLGQDPFGPAEGAQRANRDFQNGTVEATVAFQGEWQCPFRVRGTLQTLRVTKEG